MTHSARIKFLLLSIILGGLFFKAEANNCFSESFRDTTKIISKKRFDYFIKLADTPRKEQKKYHENTASCIWGTYKIISDEYILRVNTNFFSEDGDGYYEIDVDSLLTRKTVEILVYDSANSTLQNICTDVGDWNNPKANRKLRPSGGKIIVAFTKVNSPYHEHAVTLFIKELNFYDPVSSKSVFLKNVLAWKIYWEGIPG